MIADDLFAGAGGWDLGAAALGIHARGVELMKEARETRDAAGLETIHDDVWTYVPDGKAKGLIASPPCPTFSAAGKGAGRKNLDLVLNAISAGGYTDIAVLKAWGEHLGQTVMKPNEGTMTALVLTPLHFATQCGNYHWLAWEQVPAVLPVWEACAEVLRAQGWNVWVGTLHSEQYGVGQARTRAVLLASRDHEVDRPAPTHSLYHRRNPKRLDEGVLPWVTMAQALEAAGFGHWGLTSRPAPTVTGGGTETGGAEPIAKIVERWTTRPDWCFRRPSTSIVGSFKPEVIAAPGWRTTVSRQNAPDSVRVTVEEAGVLQSFPADYPWQGAQGKRFLQVGNAVPPLMALAALEVASGIQYVAPVEEAAS